MEIVVEFTGIARAIAGSREVGLSVPENTTYNQIVGLLGEKYPGLLGVLIAPDGSTLLNANVFSRAGDEVILPDNMDDCPQTGDRLILLSVIVGGSLTPSKQERAG